MDTSHILGPEGPFAAKLKNFRVRRGQLRLAQTATETLAQEGALIAEAATGTGKTLAYLVPALQYGEKVLISTGTRNLQDQLFYRD